MNVCPTEYWIWLQTALGAGANTADILSYFETPERLYLAGSEEWRLSGLFTEKRIEALKSSTPSQTAAIFNECKARGYTILTPDNPDFPTRLKNLPDMPLVLYGLGDCSVIKDELVIGMVGTRNASRYGIETAQKLSYRLAEAGATVVSGGALGIDSEAHAGAMLAKGRTMAFLGCGLSCDYLKENAPLRRAITRYGALFSEYAPLSAPTRSSFPIRNRLISGVSLGIVVIEAGVKSGSLITASRASEQGKDIFAVPGDIIRSSFDGANHLIRKGAKPVFTAEDILGEYEYKYAALYDAQKASQPLSELDYVEYRKSKASEPVEKINEPVNVAAKPRTVARVSINTEPPKGVSENARRVFEALTHGEMHIDDIVRATNLKMNTVLSSLTELELFGAVVQMAGKKYKLK